MKTSRRRAVALSAGALALALFAPAAQAATWYPPPAGGSGWRLNTVVSVPHRPVVLVSVDAVSAADAWAAGTVFSDYGTVLRPLLEHWNGKSWRSVALPADAARHFGEQDIFANVAAVSRTDVWAVSFVGRYARLRGTRWTFGALPGSASGKLMIDTVKAFGPADVWAFGSTSIGPASALKFAPYAARFDGRRWTRISVPGRGILGPVSAVSARDIWAVTGGERPLTGVPGAARVLRWNGAKWRPVTVQPTLSRRVSISGILATNDSNVWIGGAVKNSKSGTSELAMHWNGKTWTTASPQAPATGQDFYLGGFVPSARGGFWAIGGNLDGAQRIWHYSAGRWSAPIHSAWELFQLAAVPNTTSTWGVGWNTDLTNGVIVLNGPRPR